MANFTVYTMDILDQTEAIISGKTRRKAGEFPRVIAQLEHLSEKEFCGMRDLSFAREKWRNLQDFLKKREEAYMYFLSIGLMPKCITPLEFWRKGSNVSGLKTIEDMDWDNKQVNISLKGFAEQIKWFHCLAASFVFTLLAFAALCWAAESLLSLPLSGYCLHYPMVSAMLLSIMAAAGMLGFRKAKRLVGWLSIPFFSKETFLSGCFAVKPESIESATPIKIGLPEETSQWNAEVKVLQKNNLPVNITAVNEAVEISRVRVFFSYFIWLLFSWMSWLFSAAKKVNSKFNIFRRQNSDPILFTTYKGLAIILDRVGELGKRQEELFLRFAKDTFPVS